MEFSNWIMFAIAIIASSLTVLLLKHHTVTQNRSFIALAIISDIILIFAYITLLSNNDMVTAYPFIKIISIIVIILLGALYYEEHLTVENKIGLGLGVVALVMMSRK